MYLCIVVGTASLQPRIILPQICTVQCTKLRKHFAKKHCNYRSVLLFHRCNRFAWRCIKLQWQNVGSCNAHSKQGGCQVRQSVRIKSEILAIWAALKQLSEDKHDAMCVVLLRLMKTKNINMLLSFCQHCHLTWQNWAKFFGRGILTLRRWKLP